MPIESSDNEPWTMAASEVGDLATSTTSSNSLACGGCRKAKQRCSKDRPKCSHCRKAGLACIYETQRGKPGLKVGAVGDLHRRLDDLERRMDASDCLQKESVDNATQHDDHSQQTATTVLMLLARELPRLVHAIDGAPVTSPSTSEPSHKRKRLDDTSEIPTAQPVVEDSCPQLPEHGYLETILNAYFSNVHPWIPMIHQPRFLEEFAEGAGGDHQQISVVLHAMIIAAMRFLPDIVEHRHNLQSTRRWVLYTAMETMSLHNLQALIILAWNGIVHGNAVKAWSIIGSLTRTVEYMQLTQEHRDGQQRAFCQPYTTLQPTNDWTVIEERRRVFWTVFLLDRFCSVSMGWSTSLTSNDVHRRLPCDGVLWRRQEPVVTPFFGIWDKTKGRLGNPIRYASRHVSPSSRESEPESRNHDGGILTGNATSAPSTNMSTVGALAYNIEAMESMSRVMTHFLQQRVDLRDQREIDAWLTRFKELDLRLVHWKMLLPHKLNLNLKRPVPLMDPNLTAAHVTHNASMILLHQIIAYPPAQWNFRDRLPSACSAEACYMAGIEISTISSKYLSRSLSGSPVSSQVAFCLFLAARVLLIRWRYAPSHELAPEFWLLIRSLEEMSRRWKGLSSNYPDEENLFMKYVARLRGLHVSCELDDSFQINVMDYTNDIDHCRSWSNSRRSFTGWPGVDQSPLATVSAMRNDWSSTLGPVDFGVSDFMLGDFTDLDRVIAFDDGSMFVADL